MGVFGKVQSKTASRFSSKGKQPEAGYAPDVTNAQLETPPPPMAYSGLKSGPAFDIEYEPHQAPPLELSKNFLRNLSPFMIQVEPPLAYADTAATDTNKKDVADIIAAGHVDAPSAFRASRNRIMTDIAGGGISSYSGSVESFVSNGQIAKTTGSDKIETKKLDGGGPNRIGTPAIADVRAAVDITMQLRALVQTPPLIMLINPQSLAMTHTKLQQFSDRTRYGYVFQAWGEEQPKLSVSARCGAFVSGGRGVQWASRRDSAAWHNLATAFQFYKNNGYIYDTIGKSNAHHFVGALSIHYDQWVYYGNMESFSYSFDETNQLGGVTFEMEFTVNAAVDTSKQTLVVSPMRAPTPSASDPRYFGVESKAKNRPGTFSIGGTDAEGNVTGLRGQQSWHDINGVQPQNQGSGQVSLPSVVASAVRNDTGFVPSPGDVSAAVPIQSSKSKPFGFGR